MRHHILPLALAALSLAACRHATAPTAPPAVPLSLRATVARTTVAAGDTVTVRLTARNLGARAVTIDSPHGCRLRLRLQSPEGEPYETIVFRSGGCASSGPLTLAPGDSLVETGRWEAAVLIGGDVLTRAHPGVWLLHPIILSSRNTALPGTLDVPATVTVVSR